MLGSNLLTDPERTFSANFCFQLFDGFVLEIIRVGEAVVVEFQSDSYCTLTALGAAARASQITELKSPLQGFCSTGS
jgi:hypothetical protein